MKKKKYQLQKDLTIVSFSLFVLVASWVGFTIYHTYVTSTITDTLQIRIQPIDGKFDSATIAKLRKRTAISPLFSNPLGTESAGTERRFIAPTRPVNKVSVTPTLQPEEDTQVSPQPSPEVTP